MRLARFADSQGAPALGVLEGEEIVDLSGADTPTEPAAALALRDRTRRFELPEERTIVG